MFLRRKPAEECAFLDTSLTMPVSYLVEYRARLIITNAKATSVTGFSA